MERIFQTDLVDDPRQRQLPDIRPDPLPPDPIQHCLYDLLHAEETLTPTTKRRPDPECLYPTPRLLRTIPPLRDHHEHPETQPGC